MGAAARAGAGDRTERDLFVADADKNFGRRSEQREAVQVEEIEEGRWVDAPQRAVEVEGRQVEGGRETLRQDDLKDIARRNIILRGADHELGRAACRERV